MGGSFHMRAKAICTIGYEGGTIDAFIRTLRQAKVELVLDIRAAPVSRKLATHLSEAGIGYRHLRGLGTPKRGRGGGALRALESFERIFLAHVEEPEALLDLGAAIALAQDQPVCPLCLERNPEHCHGMIVANRMAEQTGQELHHLLVQLEACHRTDLAAASIG
jgi:uncharacterized protein (DUF488 family)